MQTILVHQLHDHRLMSSMVTLALKSKPQTLNPLKENLVNSSQGIGTEVLPS